MIKRSWLLVAVCLSLFVSGACRRGEKAQGTPDPKTGTESAQAPATAAAGTEPGAMFPEYSAMNLDGSRFEMASRRNKVVLVNVWATWCGPCRFEIPELQRIHNAYAARNFEVVGVSVDESGIETVRQFATEQKMTYPVVLDPQGKIANMLETSVLPTSVLVGRDGRILWKKVGAIFEGDEELKSAIEKAL